MKRERTCDARAWKRRRCLGVILAMFTCLFLVLALTSEVWARSSGGRYGGRAGFSQSRSGSSGGGWASPRSVPARPYSGPTSPGYYPPVSGPGFGFFPFFLPFLGWGGGSGGFGFGGIIGVLLILGIVALIGKVLLQNLANAYRDRADRGAAPAWGGGDRYAVVKCQLGLLSTARTLQRELRDSAAAATTNTVAGLAAALQDVVIALTRHSDYWRYGTVQVQRLGTIDEAERSFNQLVNLERGKLSAELTVNIDGIRRQAPPQAPSPGGEVGRYLVVTLIVATGYPEFTTFRTPSFKEMEATLQRLGTLLAADLLGLEVIWTPENPDDTLTEEELIAEYPELSIL
ncbi:MAG TPA: DUF1517 domain-containing protein [Alphaproteobacteria bacterium]|nr:DUF1517 domain-containing protein [Alphaproteobacteria bacterium]